MTTADDRLAEAMHAMGVAIEALGQTLALAIAADIEARTRMVLALTEALRGDEVPPT